MTQRSASALTAHSEELLYEIEMVGKLAHYIDRGWIDQATREWTDGGLPARNALIESFVIHARVLREFFCFREPKPNAVGKNDARAHHYAAGWKRRPEPQAFKAIEESAGSEIAHLSYCRERASKRYWEVVAIREAVGELVERFLAELRAAFPDGGAPLCTDFERRARDALFGPVERNRPFFVQSGEELKAELAPLDVRMGTVVPHTGGTATQGFTP